MKIAFRVTDHLKGYFCIGLNFKSFIFYVGNLYLYSCGVVTFYSHRVKEDTTNLQLVPFVDSSPKSSENCSIVPKLKPGTISTLIWCRLQVPKHTPVLWQYGPFHQQWREGASSQKGPILQVKQPPSPQAPYGLGSGGYKNLDSDAFTPKDLIHCN